MLHVTTTGMGQGTPAIPFATQWFWMGQVTLAIPFAALQDYIHQLAVCLHWLVLNPEPSSAKSEVTAQLRLQTEELSYLLRRLHSRPKSRNAIINAKLDEGSAGVHALNDMRYRKVTVSSVNFSICAPTHMVLCILSASKHC